MNQQETQTIVTKLKNVPVAGNGREYEDTGDETVARTYAFK